MLIAVNPFVRRQVEGSPYSYSTHAFEAVAALASTHWDNRKPGFRDGVVLVPVPVDGFVSGICLLADATRIESKFESRRKGEAPVLVTRCNGSRLPATVVELVCYSHDALGADASSALEYELVSINAGCGEPMSPVAMARNALVLEGGTETHYPEEEWAKASMFWATHAMAL